MSAVERFRNWAGGLSEAERIAEWECEFPDWETVYLAWEKALAPRPADQWSPGCLEAALYILARDWECQRLSHNLDPCQLIYLAAIAQREGEPDARWQLAAELSRVRTSESEAALLRFADDPDEYVRRRSIQSLAKLKSSAVTRLARREWDRSADDHPWSKMNALWALQRVRSPEFGKLLPVALSSSNELLRKFAQELRDGRTEP